MNKSRSVAKLRFRVHLIGMHESDRGLTIRVLLVETSSAKAVYEGLGSWSKCRRWITRLSTIHLSGEELAVVRKRLDRKRLATIQEVRASPRELESLGLRRADSYD
jgi:hypothetical protein